MIEVKKPIALVNEKRVRRNIERIAKKARNSGVRFRPHFKTHQSGEIGEWFRDYGVNSITVSSLDMAEYFYQYGWNDITIAVPVNVKQIDEITKLANLISLNLLIESPKTLEIITSIDCEIDIWIEIDVGYRRTGIEWKNLKRIERISNLISKTDHLLLKGVLTHAGHAYHTNSISELNKIHNDSVSRMNIVKNHLKKQGFSELEISIGDTPTCSVVDDFSDVEEIRPGNFVFYDITQLNLGACKEEDIALAVACPVISKYPERNELVIYGGGIHLSKDSILMEDGSRSFGSIAIPEDSGWSLSYENAFIASPSQEHGIISANRELIDNVSIGDTLFVLPIHSCLTANLYRQLQTLDGQILTKFNY